MVSLKKGLIGHWTMDNVDMNGGIIYDKSAYDGNMSQVNSPSTGFSSPLGEAVKFDPSTGDKYTTSFQDVYDISGPFSIFMWIYLDTDPDVDSNNNYREMIGPASSHTPYGILIEDTRSITYNAYVNGSRNFISSPNIIPVKEWVHIGYWFEPSTGHSAQFYNGEKSGQQNYTSGVLDSNSEGIHISNTGGSSSSGTFPGKMSDIRLYNRKVTEDEVNILYNIRSQREQNIIYPTVENIRKGCEYTTFSFVANQWNGSSNTGEIDIINGTKFKKVNGGTKDISPINNGVALDNNGSGTGYLMYSRENVHNRFTNPSPHSSNCNHVIGVVYNNGWKYDDNNGANNSFKPRNSDVLIAEFEYSVSSVSALDGFTR